MARESDIRQRIEGIVGQIRHYKTEQNELEACIEDLKIELRNLLEAYGSNWSDDEGYARILADAERTYYDTNALDQLIIEDPLHYGWLKDYRQKSPIKSRIQVK